MAQQHAWWNLSHRAESLGKNQGSAASRKARWRLPWRLRVSTAASLLINDWTARFGRESQSSDVALRRELCSRPGGIVVGSWCVEGTGNCVNKVIAGMLLAVALDRPFVLATNISQPYRRAFDASLSEAGTGFGGMPWLQRPRCIEDSALPWQHPTTRNSSRDADAVRAWCFEAGVTLAGADVESVDLRHTSRGPWAAQGMLSRPGFCNDFSSARVVFMHGEAIANFWLLKSNRALPAAVALRIRTLSAPGVNAYGLAQRALWPDGLTRVATVERFTVAVHLRCWLTGCTDEHFKSAAACLSELVAGSGPGCSIYVASDHVAAPDLLRAAIAISPLAAQGCDVSSAVDWRPHLSPPLLAEAEQWDRIHSGPEGSTPQSPRGTDSLRLKHIATPHDPIVAAGEWEMGEAQHPAAWADPIDLQHMASAETFLGGYGTLAWTAGTRVGSRYFFFNMSGMSSSGFACLRASEHYPMPAADFPRFRRVQATCARPLRQAGGSAVAQGQNAAAVPKAAAVAVAEVPTALPHGPSASEAPPQRPLRAAAARGQQSSIKAPKAKARTVKAGSALDSARHKSDLLKERRQKRATM